MVVSTRSFSALLVMKALVVGVNGHGYMTEPAVTFLSSSTDNTQFIATIESSASGFSGTFSGSPADNTAAFTTAFKASSYTSLKELINDKATITVTDATLTCGSCDPDETAQPLPDKYVEWSHSSTEGFTSSHEGPCEVWCDDIRVFQDDDCAADYTSAPAELPYDRDACLGTSTLTFYWLALHSSTWQVYINCAPLETTTSTGAVSSYAVSGSSSGTSTTTTNSTSTTNTAATSSTASSSYNFGTNFATSTSASTDGDDSGTTVPDTSTPTTSTTTTDAPATTTANTSKCSSLLSQFTIEMVASAMSFSSVLATAVLAAGVNAHGYMSDPAVTFLTTNDPTQFIATIEASASGFSGTFNGAPADNTAAFTTAFESSSYSSLKEFINDKATITVTDSTLTCGSCDPDETAQPLPDTYVEWAHSDSEGFTASHEGPCEIWCDDVRVFHGNDCAADYTTAPAQLPYDHDACLGSSVLTFYWMALHSSTWQVYVNCAPLESTTSTGATSKYAVGTSTSTATTSTVSSTAGSSAASNSSSLEFQTNYATSDSASTSTETSTTTDAPTTAPVATTATPATTSSTTTTTTTTTDAPVASTDTTKCTVRRRRN
ncbi:Hypothetical protein PHPALM_12309 [Phytophthora palmivora]|uniref:Carbohydrate-binding protein n=1 Tax=Phytophthora palmivora TaxID=4796 RepID=A0A2P4Y041_9STRA|nr:Hypothetical protein PHPALM_12309 [Phytophthora palmivora]